MNTSTTSLSDPHNILGKLVALVEAELEEKTIAHDQREKNVAVKEGAVAEREKRVSQREAQHEAQVIADRRQTTEQKIEADRHWADARAALESAATERQKLNTLRQDIERREGALQTALGHLSKLPGKAA